MAEPTDVQAARNRRSTTPNQRGRRVVCDVSTDYLLGRASLAAAIAVNTKRPASEETGRSGRSDEHSVAGAGFEPTTSGL